MKRRLFITITALSLSFAGLPAGGEDEKILLVVNSASEVTTLDAATLKNFFLGTRGFWENGTKVTAYQRPEDSAPGKRFFSSVLKMAPSRYRHHWQVQQLSGQGVEPETVAGAAVLIAKVAGKPGAIGYILESEKDAAANAKVKLISLE